MKEFSAPDMLYLDYDRPRPPEMWELFRVFHILNMRPVWFRFDRTCHGWHVIIKLPRRLDRITQVALQAVLGSDPRRETLNLMRCLESPDMGPFAAKRWNILFREKVD